MPKKQNISQRQKCSLFNMDVFDGNQTNQKIQTTEKASELGLVITKSGSWAGNAQVLSNRTLGARSTIKTIMSTSGETLIKTSFIDGMCSPYSHTSVPDSEPAQISNDTFNAYRKLQPNRFWKTERLIRRYFVSWAWSPYLYTWRYMTCLTLKTS